METMFTKQNLMMAAVLVTAYLVYQMYRSRMAAATTAAQPSG
jgi:hypothetical protein